VFRLWRTHFSFSERLARVAVGSLTATPSASLPRKRGALQMLLLFPAGVASCSPMAYHAGNRSRGRTRNSENLRHLRSTRVLTWATSGTGVTWGVLSPERTHAVWRGLETAKRGVEQHGGDARSITGCRQYNTLEREPDAKTRATAASWEQKVRSSGLGLARFSARRLPSPHEASE
jgi:hypothetical protein